MKNNDILELSEVLNSYAKYIKIQCLNTFTKNAIVLFGIK